MPLLQELGWDTANVTEIFPQKELPGAGKVDYDLQVCPQGRIFIEVKNWKVELKSGDEPEKQLERYCRVGKPSLGVLTNGRQWWFYVPPRRWPAKSKEPKLSDYIFLELSIFEDAVQLEKRFKQFLSRARVSNKGNIDQTLIDAYDLLQERINDTAVMTGLTKAWNDLADDDDIKEYIVGKLAERRNIQAKESQILNFLHSRNPSVRKISDNSPLSFPRPASLTLHVGDGRPVIITVPRNKGWNHLLHQVCQLLLDRHCSTFYEHVLGMPQWFSRTQTNLKAATLLDTANIYVAYGTSAELREFIPILISRFGYSPESVTIDERKSQQPT